MTAAATRTRLRPAVHVATVEGGLLFVGWQHSLVVSGPEALGKLWQAVFPHLHDGVDVESLLDALPDSARPTARRLLDELGQNGFLLEERSAEESPPVPAENALGREPFPGPHARTLAFLESAADDPVAAWRRFRLAPITVHGGGAVAVAAARALRTLGAAGVGASDPAVASAAELTAPAPPAPDVLVLVDAEETGGAVPSVGVAQLGERALVTPVRTGTGAADLLARMRAAGHRVDRAELPVVAANLAGNLAALQAFYHLAGVSTENDGRALLLEAQRLRTTAHPVFEHRGPAVSDVDGSAEPQVDMAALADLTDACTGVLPAVLPGELPQVPHAVAESASGRAPGFGSAVGGDVARYRAALDASRSLARSFAPGDIAAAGPVRCCGSDVDGMLRDGVVRLVAGWLADPDQRALRLTGTGVRDYPAAGEACTAASAEVRAALRQARVVTDRPVTVRTARPVAAPQALLVAELVHEGRTVAVCAHPDPEVAVAAAITHATAVWQAGPAHAPDPVPVLAVPPSAELDTDPGDWAPRELLDALCLPGERPVTARWRGEPGLDAIGAVGWVGVTRVDGADHDR